MPMKSLQRNKTTLPMPVLVYESRLLYEWCQDDKNSLLSVGFDWKIVETLPSLCDKGENLFVQCKVERIDIFRQKRALALKFKDGALLRSEITNKIRYSLYNSECTTVLPGYSRRRTQSEIISDLHNVAGFCLYFKEQLNKIQFDMSKVDVIKNFAEDLRNEHLRLYGLELEYRDLRKAYLISYKELYAAVQQLRRCAFEVFPPKSLRRKGYISQYRVTHS